MEDFVGKLIFHCDIIQGPTMAVHRCNCRMLKCLFQVLDSGRMEQMAHQLRYLKDTRKEIKTDVVNDPLGQTHIIFN